jgi:hypothetical protein
LRSREERALSIVRQSKEQGFAVRFWPGVIKEGQPRHKNIADAFKQIVRHAITNDLPHVTIAEDDCLFTAPIAWTYFRAQKPNLFDLYLGGIYAGNLVATEGRKKLYSISNGFSGITLVTINQCFYNEFLTTNCDEQHLDRVLGMSAYKRKFFVCRPFCCKQITPTYSENMRKEVSDYLAYEDGWEYLK